MTFSAIKRSDCQEFNAFRAFLVMAACTVFLALVVLLGSVFGGSSCGSVLASILSMAGLAFGVISLALFVDLIKNQNVFDYEQTIYINNVDPTAINGYGVAFWLHAAAVAASFAGTFLAACCL